VNYLIPIDARLVRDFDVEAETISLDRVLRAIDSARRLRLVILDACRENPFAQSMKRSSRAVGRGFARVEPAAPDTLVAFAAKAGSIASDGDGANSPFTAALLKHLATPGLDVRLALGLVRDEVMETTRPRQEPFVYGSLGGRTVSIVDAPAGAANGPAVGASPSSSEAERAWAVTQNTTSIAVLEEFIRRFSDSFYAALARVRLEELKKSQTAALPPPAPVPQAPPLAAAIPPPAAVAAVVPPVVPVAPAGPCSTGAQTVSFTSRPACPLSAAEERAIKPKDVFKECDKCPEMVVVPSGSFTMGSPANEEGRSSDEGPQHAVTISKPFAVGRFAVTFDEWDACVADGGCKGYKPEDRWGRGRRPVINVSWDDAKAYLAWLSRKTGKTYRLLSEAEREYITRAGTSTPFWWGASISTNQANYDGNGTYGSGSKGEHRNQTVPVDSFPPNAFGLYQVHGNVYEWVEDCYHDGYSGAPSDGTAWVSGDCNSRVLRNGSWFHVPKILRAANRYKYLSGDRSVSIGLRLARTL